MPSNRKKSAHDRLVRLKRGLPRQVIARRSGHDVPKNPFFARAGGSAMGGPLPAGRATRGVTMLVVGALLLIGGRWYFTQRVNLGGQVERILRTQFIPELEKQIGAKIEIGTVETDLLGRVVVNDIFVGRNASLPTGALAKIAKVTVSVDLPGLVLQRVTIPEAIRSVTIDSPEVYVRRDQTGLNWAKLIKTSPSTGPKIEWTGRVTANNGRVYYIDTVVPSASKKPLIMDARGIDATVDALAKAPYRFNTRVRKPLFGAGQLQLNEITSDGAIDSDFKHALAGVNANAVPLAPFGDFAFPKRDVTVRGGDVSGNVQVTLDDGVIAPHGSLVVTGGAVTANTVFEPNSKRPLQVDALSGPIQFAGQTLTTPGASARVLDTLFSVRGAASLGNLAVKTPVFDFDVATKAIPFARLQTFLKPSDRSISFTSGPSALNAHLSGTETSIAATGIVNIPGARLIDTKRGIRANFSSLKALFAGSTKNSSGKNAPLNWRFASRISAPSASVNTPQGQVEARNLIGNAKGVENGAFDVDFDTGPFLVKTPRYGQSKGGGLRIAASTPSLINANWRGTANVRNLGTDGLNLAAVSPQAAGMVRKSGQVNLNANFSGIDNTLNASKIETDATFSLSGLELNQRAFAETGNLPLGAEDFDFSAIRGRAVLRNGLLQVSRASAVSAFGQIRLDASVPIKTPQLARVALSIPQLEVSTARVAPFLRAQNVAVDGAWRGRLSVLSGQSKDGKVGIEFDLRSVNSRLRGLGANGANVFMDAPRLQGRADFNANAPAQSWNATATLTASEARIKSGSLGRFAALPANLSGARAVGLKVDLLARANSLPSRKTLDWGGDITTQRVSAPLPIVGRSGTFVTLSDVNAHLEPAAKGIEVSRFAARLGQGRVEGNASLIGGKATARIMARDIELASMQRLLSPASLTSARVTGTANATMELVPGSPARAEVRLAKSAIALPTNDGDSFIPLDGAKASATFDETGTIKVSDVMLWSAGGRITANATLAPANWSGDIVTSGFRLETLADLPFAKSLENSARPDGLVDGKFSFNLNPKDPTQGTLTGEAELRLATVMGANIDSSSFKLNASNAAQGWKADLILAEGRAEGAPLNGEVHLDSAANSWQVKLNTRNLDFGRVSRLGALNTFAGSGSRDDILARSLPVKGNLTSDIELSGTLTNAEGRIAPKPQDGFAHLTIGSLSYRGKPFGALRADIEMEEGVAKAKTLTLSRFNAPTGQVIPLVNVTGVLPSDLDSPALDAKVSVARAPLGYFSELLRECRDALNQTGISVPLFEKAVAYVDQLPPGTTGNVAMEAEVQGAWRRPRIHVTDLNLRDGRTRIPAGGYSPPATLDAAFVFENNAIAIEKAEFRLKKSPVPDADTVVAGAAPPEPNPDADTEDDDTLLRIEPGSSAVPEGAIEISADVFNANLSQLSTWVPALRGTDGGPLLRGDLTEFSFRVGGITSDPEITGSIQAEELAFSKYTLDRLRVSRFQIGKGSASIAPGNLTLVKGAFQSSSAYGSVPWSWAPPGPVRNAPIDVHFPLQTRDFGALIGIAVPSLSVAEADDFQGAVDVNGTLDTPQIAGFITVKNGQFRLDPKQDSLQTGVTNVSGTVRFVGGNQVVIDADDPLKGKFVAASSIVGRVARREEPRNEPAAKTVAAAAGPDPKPKATSKKNESFQAPQLGGEFLVRGSVTRAVEVDTDAVFNPASALAKLRYDLSVSLDNGLYTSNQFQGVSDVSIGIIWKTGPGEKPEEEQNIRWMLAAKGTKARRLKTGGQLTSFGSLTLRPDFGANMDAFGYSRANDFTGEEDFASFPVAKRIDFKRFPDRRAQLRLDQFATGMTGAGVGVIDGRLVLDNRPRVQQAPTEAVRLQNASLLGRGSKATLFNGEFTRKGFNPLPRTISRSNDDEFEDPTPPRLAQNNPPRNRQREAPNPIIENSTPLRLGGTLVLDQAEIYGSPAGGGEGGIFSLSRLPAAPVFDIKFEMGRDVEIVTTAFRSGLTGYLVASGSPNDPQILGTLETRDGQVRFPNARARVDEGRVTIAINRDIDTDGLRTRVEIDATARGTAGRYTITLRLRGPLDLGSNSTQNLKIDVTSNPPLSQNEAFAQLLGTAPNADGNTNQAYASSVLSILSAPLFSGVEQALAQTFGLSSVGLDYRLNEPVAVQLTKTLGDRIIVSYRRSIGNVSGNSGRTPFEIRVEYRLKGNYTVGVSTDERRNPAITLQRSLQF